MYNHELREAGLELTQYTILMTLDLAGEITQGALGGLLSLDSTTLTRMMAPLLKQGWIAARQGEDRRQRLLHLSRPGRAKLREAQPHWERAQRRLCKGLTGGTWKQMPEMLLEITLASEVA